MVVSCTETYQMSGAGRALSLEWPPSFDRQGAKRMQDRKVLASEMLGKGGDAAMARREQRPGKAAPED